ncbi:protein SLC31A2-like [Bolinopsis microptera]|uniref:protein SLC31A2-like n=1 Tax=Bolinopsis microptera TaxID=2820187 RepID=UPI003079A519
MELSGDMDHHDMSGDMDQDTGKMDTGGDAMDHGGTDISHGSIFYASRYASILFKGANTTSPAGLILAVVIVLIVSISFEVLRRYKAYFDDPLGKCKCLCGGQETVVVQMRGSVLDDKPGEKTCCRKDDAVILPGTSKNGNAAKKIQKMCLRHRTIYTAVSVTVHMLSLTISYFLMLVAMTFNVWLFLAVILGSGLGKLITMTLMEYKEETSQSHCNMP